MSENIIIKPNNEEEDPEKIRIKGEKAAMKRMLSLTRKAVQDYDMISEGDRVCVGISGGKDSMALLTVLAGLRRFYPKKFELCALSVSTGFEGMDFAPVAEYCKKLDVEYKVIETQIKEIVFDIRNEKNPCALCANLRRGALNDNARKMGCNVVALGHHRDDVIETAFLSLSYEGRFYCFSPKTYLERSQVTVIRPFLFIDEYEVKNLAKFAEFPIVTNPCPMDRTSKRAEVKELLSELTQKNPDFKMNIFGAVKRGIWENEVNHDKN
jgi:tRNA(Ile)-lysidine synthase TilS/MesJ